MSALLNLVMLLIVVALPQQQPASDTLCGATMEYESHNQLEPTRHAFRRLRGRVVSLPSESPEIGVCMGLFEEHGQQLVATTVTGSEGSFDFGGIPHGYYRIVVKAPIGVTERLWMADVPVCVAGWPSGGFFGAHRIKLLVDMRGMHPGGGIVPK